MKAKEKYYQIVGKNKHIPVSYYTTAKNQSEAKQNFFIESGDTINYVLQITKKLFLLINKNTN